MRTQAGVKLERRPAGRRVAVALAQRKPMTRSAVYRPGGDALHCIAPVSRHEGAQTAGPVSAFPVLQREKPPPSLGGAPYPPRTSRTSPSSHAGRAQDAL